MKLIKLKMAAFGPYGGEEEINFLNFYGQSLFLITGNTGAGKTTIFDAICFALYGSVCGQKKEAKTLRSMFAKPQQLCFVEFDFESNGKTYKIRREPEQLVLKAGGEGFKQKKHSAQLFMPDGQVKTNLKEISSLIVNSLVGFDRASFNKVAMLPQGQFQKLLSERGEQQLKTFRSIFETEVYEQIANRLFDFKQSIVKNFDMFEQQNVKTVELIVCTDSHFFKLKKNVTANFKKIVNFLEQKNKVDSIELTNCGLVLQKIELSLQQLEAKLHLLSFYDEKKRQFEQIQIKLGNLNKQQPPLFEFEQAENLVKKVESLQFLNNSFEDLKSEKSIKINDLEKLKTGLQLAAKKLNLACAEFEKTNQIDQKLNSLQVETSHLNSLEKVVELAHNMKRELFSFEGELKQIELKMQMAKVKSLVFKLKTEIDRETELAKTLKLLVELGLKKQFLQEQLKKLRIAHDELIANFFKEQAFHLAEGLEEGKPCPVCGATVHPAKAKKTSSNGSSQGDVEKSRLKILNCEEQLQHLLSEEGFAVANLKACFNLNLKNFSSGDIKQNFKNCVSKINELKLNFKQQVPEKFWNFKLQAEVDYEAEVENLSRQREKILASVAVLKNKMNEMLKKVPINLQNLSAIEKFKKSNISKQTELNNKKNELLNAKLFA